HALPFLSKMAKMVADTGFTRLSELESEEALQNSEKELRSLFRAAPIGIGLVRDRVFMRVNDRMCEMTGYSKKELIGQSARMLYPTDDDYAYVGEEKYKQILRNGTGSVETKWQKKDRTIIDIVLSSTPIDLNDLSKGVTFTALDITSPKKKASELLESEEKYRSIMDSMVDATYICSSNYRIEYMNPAMILRTGYDATGEICYKVIHGRNKKCPWCISEKVMNGESVNYEIVSPKDDKIYYISNSPIFHTDGSISKLTVFRDVTKFKIMEQSLQQSQKMESIGTLAGGIAHDFNNILFPIVGHAELLIDDISEDSPIQGSLNEIYNAALRARDLVKQILTFSRQESSDLKLIKIQHVIQEALTLVRSTIPTTIDIQQDIQPDCNVIKADPTNIHQIIMNLATNAHHAMQETGGKLKISLKENKLGEDDLLVSDIDPGTYACLTIADTGIGMDQDLVEKIFDPFFTTKEQGKGTGMGLSVVHGIVNNMGGDIQVKSEPGKGTKFHIYLPILENSSEKINIKTEKPILFGTERILLVDDEKDIITIASQMLIRLGYKVTSMINSIEALEVFQEESNNFDIVITDMAMPNMSGDKFSEELIKIRSDIPVLICTGFSETMSEVKAASLGIKGFLMKPIVMQELAQKVREILDKN
ncbi:MAG: PAS domain S-box protein, partial [Desulfobacteraceae bacterium]|nr:PAS domain S-box protein [Desulfobacteraceae bacterium]